MSAQIVPDAALDAARSVTDGLIPDPLLLAALLAAAPLIAAEAEKRGAVKVLRNAARCLNPLLPASFAGEIDRLADEVESGERILS